jgi:hypothetical protein
MVFGLIVKKWGALARPLSIKLIKMKRLMVANARLNNFCINERLAKQENNQDILVFTPRNVRFTAHETKLRESAADLNGKKWKMRLKIRGQ